LTRRDRERITALPARGDEAILHSSRFALVDAEGPRPQHVRGQRLRSDARPPGRPPPPPRRGL